jgi:hypothetical protein
MILLKKPNRAFSTERFFHSPNSSVRMMSLRNYTYFRQIFSGMLQIAKLVKNWKCRIFYLFCMEVLHLNIEQFLR